MKYLSILFAIFLVGCIEDPYSIITENPSTTKTAIIRNNCNHSIVYSAQYSDNYSGYLFPNNDIVDLNFQNIKNRKLNSGQKDFFVWQGSISLVNIRELYSKDTLKFTVEFHDGKKYSYNETELLNREEYFDEVVYSKITYDEGTAKLFIEICPRKNKQ